jgi:predicted dinucleotide-binding enzyme
MAKVGVIGSAVVGQTLARGFKAHGHETRIASRDPEKLADFARSAGLQTGTPAEVASWAELVVLAVSGDAAESTVRQIGSGLSGKVVIDTMNPIAKNTPPVDGVLRYFTPANRSLMELLQAAAPEAKFVKAFNSVGSPLMIDPQFSGGVRPTMFFCGNDAGAKATVAGILRDFGWDPLDMGTATAAGPIEALCQLWCIPGFLHNEWANHAFHMLKR